jgi:diadenosine tetraphosphate (Ap4A) HIT family hydrolase
MVAGVRPAPGGVVHEGDAWMVVLRSRPLLTPGEGYILLRRHCEDLSGLTDAELATLEPLMQATAQAMTTVLRPAKVHFGLCSDALRHIHWRVLPRVEGIPASNLPIALLASWRIALSALRLRRPIGDDQVAQIAEKLRLAWPRLPA